MRKNHDNFGGDLKSSLRYLITTVHETPLHGAFECANDSWLIIHIVKVEKRYLSCLVCFELSWFFVFYYPSLTLVWKWNWQIMLNLHGFIFIALYSIFYLPYKMVFCYQIVLVISKISQTLGLQPKISKVFLNHWLNLYL